MSRNCVCYKIAIKARGHQEEEEDEKVEKRHQHLIPFRSRRVFNIFECAIYLLPEMQCNCGCNVMLVGFGYSNTPLHST